MNDLPTAPVASGVTRATSQDVRWYALWTRSRHEQVVREQLEQKRVEAFLPTVTRWSRWKDRKKKIDWPLFPGYCFARFNPRERLPILKCTGVVSIISFEGEPAPIPEHEIDGIRAAALFANDVIPTIMSARQLVEAGAVVQIAAAHQTETLKRGETAINRNQVARLDANDLVQTLDAYRTFLLKKGFNQRNARLGHAHICSPDAVARFLQKVAITGRGERMVGLGRCDHPPQILR